MPAIFSSIYLLKPWISETTVTNAVTPTIMPSRVKAERSLCAQIAPIATFKISRSFTGLIIRAGRGFSYRGPVGAGLSTPPADGQPQVLPLQLFPTQRFNWIQARRLPRGP